MLGESFQTYPMPKWGKRQAGREAGLSFPGALHGCSRAVHTFSPMSVLAVPCGGFTNSIRKANGHFMWCQELQAVACTNRVTPASIAPSIAAPPCSSEHQHTDAKTHPFPPHTPGLLAATGDEGEGGVAKYHGKRLRERREKQAEDLGPDLSPSPESTLPLTPFAWLFFSLALSPTCWVEMQTKPLMLPLPLMPVTRLQSGAILREPQLVTFPVAAGNVRFFRCSNGKLSNKLIPSGDAPLSLVFAHPLASEHVAPPWI